MGSVTVLSSDAHVCEPPDLWTKRIDAAFRDRAPRMERVDGADEIVVEQGQVLSGIGLLSNTGVRFEAPEAISGRARFEDVPRGGYDPDQHLRDMRLDGVGGVSTVACSTCHGSSWATTCTMCHGGVDNTTGAPPKATWGQGADLVRL